MKKRSFFSYIFLLTALLAGCKKDDSSQPGGGSGVFSDGVWALAIIPADGQQYDVDLVADDQVIQLRLQGKDHNEICNGTILWRYIW